MGWLVSIPISKISFIGFLCKGFIVHQPSVVHEFTDFAERYICISIHMKKSPALILRCEAWKFLLQYLILLIFERRSVNFGPDVILEIQFISFLTCKSRITVTEIHRPSGNHGPEECMAPLRLECCQMIGGANAFR